MTEQTLGRRIAERRKLLGLSQEGLGEKLEVSRQAVSKWEADGAVPDVDKLIAMSRLFSVSVGWLLGVEETQESAREPAADTLTEAQLKLVEQIIRSYAPQPEPVRKPWGSYLLGICGAAALVIAGLVYAQTRPLVDTYPHEINALSGSYSAIQSQLGELSNRIDALKAAAQEEKLLSSYSLIARAKADMSGGVITFEGFPSQTVPTDQVWLTVRLDGQVVTEQMCQWDGIAYKVEVELPPADGYSYHYLVVHQGGSSSQQILEDVDYYAENLAQGLSPECDVDINGWEVSFRKLYVTDCFIDLKPPALLTEGKTATWENAELVFLRRGSEIARFSILQYTHLLLEAGEGDGWLLGSIYPEMDGIPIAAGDTVEVRVEAKLKEGSVLEKTVYQWTCDANGDIMPEELVG